MSAPTPRTLTGVITVQTIGTANFGLPAACGGAPPSAGICITATSPTGTVITEATAGPTTIVRLARIGNTLPFEIRGAQPGTWQVSVSEPTDHDEFGNTIPVDMTVDPGTTPVPGFNMSLVENATLELTLADGNATPITTAPTIQLNGVTYPSTFVPASVTPAKAAHFVVTNIPVDALDPLTLPGRAYTLRLTLTGYDTTLTQAVPINVRAGQTLPLSLTLPKFGTLSGVVEGDEGTSVEELDIENEGTFTVTRVDVNGIPITPAGYIAPTFTIDGGQYEVSGQAGYYRIDVAHPQFGPDPTPPTDNFVPPLASPEPSPIASVFRIVNDNPNTPDSYVLPIIPGTLSISVVQSLVRPDPPVRTWRVVHTFRCGHLHRRLVGSHRRRRHRRAARRARPAARPVPTRTPSVRDTG